MGSFFFSYDEKTQKERRGSTRTRFDTADDEDKAKLKKSSTQ